MQFSLGKNICVYTYIFGSFISAVNCSCLFTEKQLFADFPPCILVLTQILLQTAFIFSQIMVEANQGGQRTRIPGLDLLLAFQVKDFASEIYTPNTQVEGSLGLLMWHFPQGTCTGKSPFGLGKFTTTNLFTPLQRICYL